MSASITSPPFPPPSPDTNTTTTRNHLTYRNPKFLSSPFKKSSLSSSILCRCQKESSDSSSSSPAPSWNSQLQEVVKGAMKRLEDYMNTTWKEAMERESVVDKVEEVVVDEVVENWDWDRWKKHFDEVDDQEKIVSFLKLQLGDAVRREAYQEAAKLKVAIAAAATNDTVGRVITRLNRAIDEERFQDAAFLRDYAGAGLVGWWAGISEDSDDPYGRIIRISPEHGRYVARSFSPRHLATATPGVPLFEIFLTASPRGKYKHQAVYLKRNKGKSGDTTKSAKSSENTMSFNPLSESAEGKNELPVVSSEDVEDSEERDDDSDMAEGLSGIQNILQDMIPGVKVTVLKVTAPEKVDKDLISKVIENIMEEEEEDGDVELESADTESDFDTDTDTDEEVKAETHQDQEDIEIEGGEGNDDNIEEPSEMAVKVVIGGRLKDLSNNAPAQTLLRVPARLEKKDRLSFSFSIEKDDTLQEAKGKISSDKSLKLQGQRSINNVMSDLAKSMTNREKIPMKVLKDVEALINFTLSQAKGRQPLSGTTTFNRIEIPASSDLLSGLYIGAHGLYASEVIHLQRKFGQWQEDGVNKKRSKLEFYEYVEAFKLTGDPHVPAGQVAFRAKVGKQYQLPHKGIIPEEFGVIARYKGQGRVAEPGFQSPRWVDGELVILDGKYIKGGPVVGFVYWAPDYHFLVFFNRLRLPE